MSRKVSRREFLAFMGASGAALLMAACKPKPTPTPPPAKPTKAAETKPTATPQPAEKKPVNLIYYYGTRVVFKDLKLVNEEMNKIMKERINATIELRPIEWAAYTDKMNAKDAAGEKYDLCFTSSWANPYYIKVDNGVLADLTEALPKWAPKYYNGMNPAVWEGPKVKGKIYGAVNEQIFPTALGPIARKDLADKYNLDLSKVAKYEDMIPWFDAILEGEGGKVTPLECGAQLWWSAYWKLDGSLPYGLVRYDDKEIKVQHPWDTDWKTCMELSREWYKKGYFPKEQVPRGECDAAVKAKKYGCTFHRAKPGGTVERKKYTGLEWVSKIIESPTILITNQIISTMYGVNKKTSSLEACVRYLELVNTDKPFYNLLCKGIEGKHWVWVDKEKEVIGFPPGLDANNHPYNPNSDWEFGNQFNAYYVDPEQVGAWEETKKINDASVPSVLLGFAVDKEPIKNELAQITATTEEYKDMVYGLLDFEKI
ncbi:MAG: DUF3502 domain-containing protein, partial [Anaerolineae bacterium]|nr:DUF3502 domain-containing protein [Anaerolineae bacterium]